MKKLFLLSLLFFNFFILSSPAGACDSDCQGDMSKIWQEETTTTTIVSTTYPIATTSTSIVSQKTASSQNAVSAATTSTTTTTTTTTIATPTITTIVTSDKPSIVYPGYYEYCRATKTCASHISSNSSSNDSFSFFSYRPAVILLWAIFSFLLFMLLNNTIKYSFMYKYGYRTWFQRIFDHN
jgi:hypothetical protein